MASGRGEGVTGVEQLLSGKQSTDLASVVHVHWSRFQFRLFFFFLQALASTGATLRPGGVAGLVTNCFFFLHFCFFSVFIWLGSAC